MKSDRNSSNFINAINLVRAITLGLVVVFHSKKGVFHRNMPVFHNSFNNYRAKDYRYKLPVFWISTAIFPRKSRGTRISTCESKARNHLSG
jgi:peptidoglycan/LPS O-acetylase OafA/YrhL